MFKVLKRNSELLGLFWFIEWIIPCQLKEVRSGLNLTRELNWQFLWLNLCWDFIIWVIRLEQDWNCSWFFLSFSFSEKWIFDFFWFLFWLNCTSGLSSFFFLQAITFFLQLWNSDLWSRQHPSHLQILTDSLLTLSSLIWKLWPKIEEFFFSFILGNWYRNWNENWTKVWIGIEKRLESQFTQSPFQSHSQFHCICPYFCRILVELIFFNYQWQPSEHGTIPFVIFRDDCQII